VTPARTSSTPERIGRYEVLLPIARGGMATVYLARSRGAGGFERDVAVKLTHAHLADSPELAADLLEEAKLTVQIRHANVASVIDAGEDPQGLFLVMEYIEGDTLAGLMRHASAAGTALAPRIGLRVLCDALVGLHAAHELRGPDGAPVGIVHRDFSPQNILVGLDGVGRLADFGVAKALTRDGHTRVGTVKGKIAYMAPEQARALPLDRRADVWAGGVMAWEILAGRRLFATDNDVATLLRIVSETPPPLTAVWPAAPPALVAAVASALLPDAALRCPTAAQLSRALTVACRDAGMPLADAAEVADVVQHLAGARLAERRARVAEIDALRRQVGALTQGAHETAMTLSAGPFTPVTAAPPSAALPAYTVETDGAPSRTEPVSVATRSAKPEPAPIPWRTRALVLAAVAAVTVITLSVGSAVIRPLTARKGGASGAASAAAEPPPASASATALVSAEPPPPASADAPPPASAPEPSASASAAKAPAAPASAPAAPLLKLPKSPYRRGR
jgi:serine/threonine-protein kinase